MNFDKEAIATYEHDLDLSDSPPSSVDNENTITLFAIPDVAGNCDGCVFDVNFDCYSPCPCRASQRVDGNNIIWGQSNASKSSE